MSANSSERLRQLLEGYRSTSLVYAAARLGIAEHLSQGVMTSSRLAKRLAVNEDALTRLLRGLQSLGIVNEDAEGNFSLMPLGKNLSASAAESFKGWAILAGEEFMPAWNGLVDAVRTGEPVFHRVFGMTPWEHRQRNPELGKLFNAGLADETARAADSILQQYDFAGFRSVADVGGGHGGFLSVILRANPHLQGVLIDLPVFLPDARAALIKAGVADRCRLESADFLNAIPGGSDIYLLKSVLHDWDDAHCGRILSNCREALQPGNRLLIIERILPAGRKKRDAKVTMLDLQMLVMYGGKERTREEYLKLTEAADLKVNRVLETESGFQIIELRRS